jgi:hypothetical protein
VLDVVHQRPDSAPEVQRAVLVVPRILDGDNGPPHHRRDLRETHRNPVDPARIVVGEQVPAGVDDLGADRKLPEFRRAHRVELVRAALDADPDRSDGGES